MRSKILFILGVTVLSFTAKVNAQTDLNNAQAIFIYNFLSHVKWPDSDVGSKYVIGVLGKTTTYDYLKEYTKNRSVGSKAIEVVQYTTPSQASNCQVLLVAFNKNNTMPEVRSVLQGKSCLIIGEKSGAIENGAAVDFRLANGKLRYKIDESKAKEHNLFVSRALLTMSL